MGILVQREFTVDGDDRAEFERQSRLGVWENMRYNGAQMIAFGAWAFGGPGDVVVTNSVYEDFDHWTATRPWGFFATSQGHIEETHAIRPIFAGRNRLIRHSRTTLIDYEDTVSEPTPRFRQAGEELAPLPPTFGRQSVVAQTEWLVETAMEEEFLAVSKSVIWPWLRAEGCRLLVFGHDPLAADGTLVTLTAFRDVSDWHKVHRPGEGVDPDVLTAWRHRGGMVRTSSTKLLMVGTDYGGKL